MKNPVFTRNARISKKEKEHKKERKKEDEEDAEAAGLPRMIISPIFTRFKKKEEDNGKAYIHGIQGAAGLPRMIINPIFTGIQETKKRKIVVKHAWKVGGSRATYFYVKISLNPVFSRVWRQLVGGNGHSDHIGGVFTV